MGSMFYSILSLTMLVFSMLDGDDSKYIVATLFLLCAVVKSSTDEIKKSIQEHKDEKKD